MAEKFYKRREARERLNISKYVYRQYIETGILDAPVRLTKNSHPFHTESQLIAAEHRLFRKSNPQPQPERTNGIISSRLFNEIRDAYQK